MVEVHICGKSYPLCMPVAVLDEIVARCGSLDMVPAFLEGKEPQYIVPPEGTEESTARSNLAKVASNTTWLLGVLIRGGEINRQLLARLSGEPVERREVPNCDDLAQLLTVTSALRYRPAVFQAIAESMNKEIEAVYQKNVKDAEQE